MHKKSIKGEITQKVIKRELSILYTTHRHDLFYITVKYHQSIPNSIQGIERTRKYLRTGWMPGSSLYPSNLFLGGIKIHSFLSSTVFLWS